MTKRVVPRGQLKRGRWLSFTASQEMAVARVEFAWQARFPVPPLVSLRVVDSYRGADGGLEVKVWASCRSSAPAGQRLRAARRCATSRSCRRSRTRLRTACSDDREVAWELPDGLFTYFRRG
jgi:hypothetical protein